MLHCMSWTVYRHITPSGKSYIGITSQKPEDRWSNGNGYKNTLFGKAIEKYKWENIKHEILDTDLDEFTAKCLEEYYIFSYQTYVGFKYDCKGYNCTLGGEGSVGFKPSKETRRKQSEAKKGKTPWKGKHHTEESKLKMSETRKGKTPWNKGKTTPEDTCKKISESKKGKKTGKPAWNRGLPAWNSGKKLVMIDGKRHYE